MADHLPQPAMGPTLGSSSSQQNRLSLANTYMAATRTLLALLRTGSTIAGGGALVTKLLVKDWPQWVVFTLSSAFVVAGYALMWTSVKKSRQLRTRFEQDPVEQAFLFPHRTFAAVTWALQILILAVVVLFLLR